MGDLCVPSEVFGCLGVALNYCDYFEPDSLEEGGKCHRNRRCRNYVSAPEGQERQDGHRTDWFL